MQEPHEIKESEQGPFTLLSLLQLPCYFVLLRFLRGIRIHPHSSPWGRSRREWDTPTRVRVLHQVFFRRKGSLRHRRRLLLLLRLGRAPTVTLPVLEQGLVRRATECRRQFILCSSVQVTFGWRMPSSWGHPMKRKWQIPTSLLLIVHKRARETRMKQE